MLTEMQNYDELELIVPVTKIKMIDKGTGHTKQLSQNHKCIMLYHKDPCCFFYFACVVTGSESTKLILE